MKEDRQKKSMYFMIPFIKNSRKIPFMQNSRKCKLIYSDRKQTRTCLVIGMLQERGEGKDCQGAQENF